MKLVKHLLIIIICSLYAAIMEVLTFLWDFPLVTFVTAKYCADNDKYFWELTDEDTDKMDKSVEE